MSFISVHDAAGHALKYINIRVSQHNLPSDQAVDDRFTDVSGHTAWPGGWVGGERWTDCTLYCNVANVQPAYGQAIVAVADLDSDITVTLANVAPVEPPTESGQYSCGWWKDHVFAIFAKHGYASVGPTDGSYLKATEAEIQALCPGNKYVAWQREIDKDLRPRLFLDNTAASPFRKYADVGDWNGPLRWEHCSD